MSSLSNTPQSSTPQNDLILHSFPSIGNGNWTVLHRTTYQALDNTPELRPLVLRPLVKAYLKVIINSKDNVNIENRLEALKEYLESDKSENEKTSNEKLLDWLILEIEEGLKAKDYEAFTYFKALIKNKNSFLKLKRSKGLKTRFAISKKENELYVVDRLFLKTAKFILTFHDNYQTALGNKLLTENEIDQKDKSLDIAYRNIVMLLNMDELKQDELESLEDNLETFNQMLTELYSDSYKYKYIIEQARILVKLNDDKTKLNDNETKLNDNKIGIEEIDEATDISSKIEEDVKEALKLSKIASNIASLKKYINLHKEELTITLEGESKKIESDNKELLEKYKLYEEQEIYLKNGYKELNSGFKQYRDNLIKRNCLLSQIKEYAIQKQPKYHKNEITNILTRKIVNKILLMIRNEKNGELSLLTSLVRLSVKGYIDKLILNLLSKSIDEIKKYASSPYRKSISGMYAYLSEIPNMKKLEKLYAWCEEICNNDNKDAQRLLSSITSMQNGKGVPDIQKLKDLYAWCEKTCDGDKENTQKLLSSITGMQNGRGVPDIQKLKDLYAWCENECDKDKENTQRLLRSITSMQNGIGVPDIQKLKKLYAWCKNACDKDKENTQRLLSSITGMQNGRGVPDIKKLKKLFAWCEEICNNDNKDTQRLLSSITGMQAGRGVPDIQKLKDLYAWCENECDKDKENTQRLLRSITSMQNGKGVPDIQKLKDLYAWCENECDKDKENRQMLLRSITGMQNGKGIPDIQKLKDLYAWCENECDKDKENTQRLLSSITGMQTGIGVPDIKKLNDLYDWCKKTCDNDKENTQRLLRSITSMQAGKGVPDIQKLKDLYAWCENECDKDKENTQRLLRSITCMQHGRGVKEIIENLDKLDNLINYFKTNYNVNYLKELSTYTSLRLGIVETCKKFNI